MQSVVLKLTCEGSVRRVSLKQSPLSIAEVHDVVSSLFGVKDRYELWYKDEEGDKISVSSDVELEEALTVGGGLSVLRLNLEKISVMEVDEKEKEEEKEEKKEKKEEVEKKVEVPGCHPPYRFPHGYRRGCFRGRFRNGLPPVQPSPSPCPFLRPCVPPTPQAPIDAPIDEPKEKEKKEENAKEEEGKKEKVKSFSVPLAEWGELEVEIERSATAYHGTLKLTPSQAGADFLQGLFKNGCPRRHVNNCGGKRRGGFGGVIFPFLLSQLEAAQQKRHEESKKSVDEEGKSEGSASSPGVEESEVSSPAPKESEASSPVAVIEDCDEESTPVKEAAVPDVKEEPAVADAKAAVPEAAVDESAVASEEEQKRAEALKVLMPLGFEEEVVKALLDVVGNDVHAAVEALVG